MTQSDIVGLVYVTNK